MPPERLFLAVRCNRGKAIRLERDREVDERAYEGEQGPPEADASSPPAQPPEPARDEPRTERPTEPGATPASELWPLAAGGGAGAVGVPAVRMGPALIEPDPFTMPDPVPAAANPDAPVPEPTPPAPEVASAEDDTIVEERAAAPVPADTACHGAVAEAAPPPRDPVEASAVAGTQSEHNPPSAPHSADVPATVEPLLRDPYPVPQLPQVEPTPIRAPVPPAAPPRPLPEIWHTETAPPTPRTRALPRPSRTEVEHYLRLALRWAATGSLALAGLVLVLVVLYRWVDPPASTLILGQRLTGTTITQHWVPLERISPNLRTAVIVSEDGQFCRHHGVDWGELKEAIDSASDGIARGGSTISMQVVKNLFLWPSRSYVRKAIEIPLAYIVEVVWSKRRILEIYLNIAEWGPGVFGAEAAARYHFRKPATQLGPRESALLAVSLPNPFERRAGRPGPGTARLADNLLSRMRAGQASAVCVVRRPSGE